VKFAEFSVNHSLFVNLLSALVFILGIYAMFTVPREAFPPIDFDLVTVMTVYPGASAEDVEKLVTSPLEKELREVDDIDEITSQSRESASSISLKINPDAKDKDKIVNDIQKAVDRVTDLPEAVEDRPVVTEINSKVFPIVHIALSGLRDDFKLQEIATLLKERLEEIPGVASVERRGYRNEEFWVEPDAQRLAEQRVSLEEIMQALASRNLSVPGGKLKTAGEEFSVKTLGEFTTKEEIEDVIIRANDQGNWLRVKDIAAVRHTFKDEEMTHRVLGTRAISLVLYKREKGDAIRIVDQAQAVIKEMKSKLPPELTITPYDDLSYYIRRRLNVLSSNGIFSFILVAGILFLFLHPRLAFFTALGIPFAMCATLFAMYVFGLSINLLTMFGLIIVLGMVVDDGIIISENVYRYVEQGMAPRAAAIKGTSEVIAPVAATVATTIVAFFPLMLMHGLLGKFVKFIPLMVIIALTASVLEAFIALPSHLAEFVRPIKMRLNAGGESIHKGGAFLARLIAGQQKVLTRALERKYLVVGIMVIALFASVYIGFFKIPFILFPREGVEEFQVYAEAPVGTSLEKMQDMIAPVEKIVAGLPAKYLHMYETNLGMIAEGRGGDPNAKYGTHLGYIHVYLTPLQKRDKSPQQIIDMLRPQVEELQKTTGFDRLYFNEMQPGPPVGKPIEVQVRGNDFKVLQEISAKVKKQLASIPGVSDISDSYDLGNRELRIVVDMARAARAYLKVGQVATSIRNAFEGGLATTIKQTKAEEEIKVLVRLPEEQRNSREVFDALLVPNSRGDLVPLRAVSRIEEGQGLRSIGHRDGIRVLTVSAGVDNDKTTSLKANQILSSKLKDIAREYPGYTIKFGGEAEETGKSMASLLAAFGIALLLIFLILATEFSSLVQPFIIMLTIPFALIGVVVAFVTHGIPLSFLAIIGLVGLCGVVVNDSIVLIDFINKLRQEGVARRESILQATALRLRPIFLTSTTTVAGLSTVAYGIGGFDPFLKPMALAMCWGLFFSTSLTLVVMPCIYAIIDDLTVKVACHPTVMALRKNGQASCERQREAL